MYDTLGEQSKGGGAMDREHDLETLPRRLLPWFRDNARKLPWRETREPYPVWVSEIMLQQTRVEAVLGYYRRLLAAFPTVEDLARAPEEQLLKLWEGLGYYSRARNLQKAARRVAEELDGRFPDSFEGLLALPGVGEYTAGAVASICFVRPCAAVDGNVLRVLSRFLADDSPRETMKKWAKPALEAVYPPGQCGMFTQALMELGATVCVPNGAPRCGECPLSDLCRAHALGKEGDFPPKPVKKPRPREELTVFLLDCGGKLALRKRPDKGLLAGLWELPWVPGTLSPEEAAAQAARWGLSPRDVLAQRDKTHVFTHRVWAMRGFDLTCDVPDPAFVWTTREELRKGYSLPTAFRQFLEEDA